MRNELNRGRSLRHARAAEVAARQWGNVTAAQLQSIGFDAERDAWLRRRGIEVWRVRRADATLAQRLRHRLQP